MVAYGEIVKIFTRVQIFRELGVQSKRFKGKSCSKLNFLQAPGVELGNSKDLHFGNIIMH